MYNGEADWTLIGEVKNNPRMHIPIIGNGDLTNPKKAKLYLDRYGVDALMIGRPSIGRPWIFKEVRHYLDTGELLELPKIPEHVEMIREHLNSSIEWLGERRGILHMRRHLAITFKGLRDFRDLKIKMLRASTADEVNQCLDQIKETYADCVSIVETMD